MHDECVNPILHLCRSERVPSISIEISGENVAVIVAFDNSGMAPAYRALYILDWKSGKAKSVRTYNPSMIESTAHYTFIIASSTCQ